jgi:bifunctional NMN adenylyltransferase/nudix hydrolase
MPATYTDLHATDIRNYWFETQPDAFAQCVYDDWKYFQKEHELFDTYPFPDTLNFNCGDAILECLGQVLLIRRKFAPGAGTWALPGGFKNSNETFVDCAIRELIEETNVRVPEQVLRGSIVNKEIFDDPKRGMGIPRNTMCVHMKIKPNSDGSLPRANGADDAMECGWFPISEVMNNMELFDDHMGIISKMCNVLPLPAHLNPKFN